MGLVESASLRAEMPVEVRLPRSGSPQTPRKRDPQWGVVLLLLLYATDACPTLQKVDVNAMFSNQGQRKYEPYSNTYNEGWRDCLNLRYGPRNNPLGFDEPSRQPSSQDRTNFLVEQVIKKNG